MPDLIYLVYCNLCGVRYESKYQVDLRQQRDIPLPCIPSTWIYISLNWKDYVFCPNHTPFDVVDFIKAKWDL